MNIARPSEDTPEMLEDVLGFWESGGYHYWRISWFIDGGWESLRRKDGDALISWVRIPPAVNHATALGITRNRLRLCLASRQLCAYFVEPISSEPKDSSFQALLRLIAKCRGLGGDVKLIYSKYVPGLGQRSRHKNEPSPQESLSDQKSSSFFQQNVEAT